VTVRYAIDDPQGLVAMIGELLRQNLARDPGRAELLRDGVAALAATDAGVAVTLRMSPGTVVVEPGADPAAQVLVASDGVRLLELAATPLRGGLPDPARAAGRRALADILTGRVRVRGLTRHLGLVRRLNRLLTVT
jgi:hypothetical protein